MQENNPDSKVGDSDQQDSRPADDQQPSGDQQQGGQSEDNDRTDPENPFSAQNSDPRTGNIPDEDDPNKNDGVDGDGTSHKLYDGSPVSHETHKLPEAGLPSQASAPVRQRPNNQMSTRSRKLRETREALSPVPARDTYPDDPEQLKDMLLAAQGKSSRLEQERGQLETDRIANAAKLRDYDRMKQALIAAEKVETSRWKNVVGLHDDDDGTFCRGALIGSAEDVTATLLVKLCRPGIAKADGSAGDPEILHVFAKEGVFVHDADTHYVLK